MDSRTNKLVSLCPPRAIYTPTTFLLRSVYVPSAFRPRAFVALLIPPSAFECVRSTTCVPRHALQCVRHTPCGSSVCVPLPVCAFHYMRSNACVPPFAFHYMRSIGCFPLRCPNGCVPRHAFHDNPSNAFCHMRSTICVSLDAFHDMRSNAFAFHYVRSIPESECTGPTYKPEHVRTHLYWILVQTENRQ